MKQNKLFLGLATLFAVAFTFTACSSDDAETQSSEPRTIRLTSSLERGSTRATTDPQSSTSLSTSSNLAIWAINQTGSAALTNGNNEQYTVNGSGTLSPKTTANTMTWPDDATLDFYAYAPYSSTYSYNEANDFSVATDQSTETNYLASDLVLAQATGKTYDENTPVALQFKHLLSKINITINLLTGSNVSLDDASVTITNTKIATTFTPNAAENAILGAASGDATDITAVADLNGVGTACAVLVPQTINAGTELVKIVAGGKTLIAKLGTNTTFESGMSYSFTVNVGTVDDDTPAVVTVALGVASITEWNSTDNTLGAVSFPKWYADFKASANNYTWDPDTKALGWNSSTNNLMTCFEFSKGELVNYKSVVIKVSDYAEGDAYRVGYYIGETFTTFNASTFSSAGAMYSGGIKIIDLEKLMDSSHHNKNLSEVKKISLGGGSNSGSVTIDYFYISTLSASDEKTALGDGNIIPNS